MVSRYLLLLCVCLYAGPGMAAQLHLKAERDRVELGQPIWISLRSDQTAVSLEQLDFSAWRKLVALPRAYYVNRNRDDTAQEMRLRVYPYHTGRLTLPGLHFLHHTTAPMQFTILPARDPLTHTPMKFTCRQPGLDPWQHQQLIVRCQLHLHDAYAVLTQPTRQPTGFRLLPMQLQKQTRGQGSRAQTRFQMGWVVFAARDGKQVLQLPPIEYVRDGVVTRRFYLAPLHLRVRPLPDWLPGTIPVGQLASVRYRLSDTWLSTSVLSQVQLRVRLTGVAPSMVPDYPAQLRSSHQFMFYRARQQQQTRVMPKGVQYQLDDVIPLVAHHIGLYRLPDLRLQYFDPVRGTLETRRIRGAAVLVINNWIKAGLVVLIVWLLAWLVRKAWFCGRRYWRRFRLYQQALAILDAPASHDGIRRCMRVMAQAEGGRANLSFLQWQAYMRRKSSLADSLPVRQLNVGVYGRGTADLALCVDRLRRICRQRRLALV